MPTIRPAVAVVQFCTDYLSKLATRWSTDPEQKKKKKTPKKTKKEPPPPPPQKKNFTKKGTAVSGRSGSEEGNEGVTALVQAKHRAQADTSS